MFVRSLKPVSAVYHHAAFSFWGSLNERPKASSGFPLKFQATNQPVSLAVSFDPADQSLFSGVTGVWVTKPHWTFLPISRQERAYQRMVDGARLQNQSWPAFPLGKIQPLSKHYSYWFHNEWHISDRTSVKNQQLWFPFWA